jgi:Excalibur calcium-binding domain
MKSFLNNLGSWAIFGLIIFWLYQVTTPKTSNINNSIKYTSSSSSLSLIKIPTPKPLTTQNSYIPGNCGDLKKIGMGNFLVGDPNYTDRRDGDGDGIACEM